MVELIKFIYHNEPYRIRIGYKILLQPLIYLCTVISCLLLLPFDLYLVIIPAFVFPLAALWSYSDVFKVYYNNRVTYWFIVFLWLLISVFVVRPLLHKGFELIFGLRW